MNSQRYNFSDNGEDPLISSDDKLCSSQSPMKTCTISEEPQPRTAVINSQNPPIPPRNYVNGSNMPVMNNSYNSFNRYSYPLRPSYGGYSYGYNGYNPTYSGYSGYSPGMFGGYSASGFSTNNPSNSRFIRAAEDSTRPAFQAIETMTRAINSLAFMMESTFGSLNMSFQAILSVIENFSHARKFLKRVITSVLTLRIFHKFLLVLVNLLRRMNILSEQAVANLPLLRAPTENTQSNISIWPFLTFFGLMFGAPYVISRMLPSEEDKQGGEVWNPSTDQHIPLVAVHDFNAGTDQELGLLKGQLLKMVPPEVMAPPSPYWVFVADENNRTGFVPRNHVAPRS